MKKRTQIILSIFSILTLSFTLAWVSTDFRSVQGWGSFLVVVTLGAGILLLGWRATRSEPVPRWVFWLTLGAAILRLAVGVLWFAGLPHWGYDTEQDRAGYIMSDPFSRDRTAWELAKSGDSLFSAFSGYRSADQYGGLLFLSAVFYRFFGGNLHQPLQIVVLTSAISAFAVLIAWMFARRLWDEGADRSVARGAAWIVALYPEAILHGSAQMREAFMMPLAGAAFYGLTLYRADKKHTGAAWIVGALLISLPLSPLFAVQLVALLVLLALVMSRGHMFSNWRLWAVLVALIVLALLGVWLFGDKILPGGTENPLELLRDWTKEAAKWQSYKTERGSGYVQKIFDMTPEWTHLWLLLVYGIVRPFLPAALLDSAALMPKLISIWRSLGWTALLALLVIAPFWAWRKSGWRSKEMGLSLIGWLGVLIASFRGGGDMWDNPRYRVTWIVLQAALVAWVWVSMREEKSPWLRRGLISMGLLIVWFLPWYMRRLQIIPWPIENVFLTLGLGILSAIVYLLWDWARMRELPSPKTRS